MFNQPQHLPDTWLIELGRITQAWAAFEQFFNLMLQKLAGFDDPFDPTFTILVAHSSMPQRLDMLASLCAAYVEKHPELSDYKNVIGVIKEAQAARNRFCHNIMSLDETDSTKAQIALVSARGKLKQELHEITLADLRKASEKITSAMRSLYILVLQPKHKT